MSNIDQDFVEFIVKSLVGKPDEVKIDRRIDEKGVLIELTVDPEDLGRIIGKRGATAQSLRTLLRALGTKNDARYNLKIIDNGPEDYRPNRSEDSPAVAPESGPNDRSDQSDQPEQSAPVEQNDSSDQDVEEEVASVAPAPVAESVSGLQDDDAEEEEVISESNSRAAKTRRELEDLDDLDI